MRYHVLIELTIDEPSMKDKIEATITQLAENQDLDVVQADVVLFEAMDSKWLMKQMQKEQKKND